MSTLRRRSPRPGAPSPRRNTQTQTLAPHTDPPLEPQAQPLGVPYSMDTLLLPLTDHDKNECCDVVLGSGSRAAGYRVLIRGTGIREDEAARIPRLETRPGDVQVDAETKLRRASRTVPGIGGHKVDRPTYHHIFACTIIEERVGERYVTDYRLS